jgi:hypothetical protein
MALILGSNRQNKITTTTRKEVMEEQQQIQSVELSKILEITQRPDLISYCSLAFRIGLAQWMMELEYRHFRPGTPLNEDFSMAMMKWPDDAPMIWTVMSIPASYRELADELAAKAMLSVKPADYRCLMLGGGKEEVFPVYGPNVFMVEGAHGSAEYGNLAERAAAQKKEDKYCRMLQREHDAWLETPEGKEASWKLNKGDY